MSELGLSVQTTLGVVTLVWCVAAMLASQWTPVGFERVREDEKPMVPPRRIP